MAENKEFITTQFRYYTAGNDKNYPDNDLIWLYGTDETESIPQKHLLSDINAGVVKLGIQGLPGTRFYLTDNPLDRGIVIDHTGVFELDLTDTTTSIGVLFFDDTSLSNISNIKNSSLIVDILYEKSIKLEGGN